MKNFRSYQLAAAFYKKASKLKLQEPLNSQFQRALLSVPLNLAEGSGKMTLKDQRRFYSISFGSIRELQAILSLIDYESKEDLENELSILAAHVYKLINPTSKQQP